MQEVLNFLKDAGTYYLATVDGNQPRVRAFSTANVFEGKLYIQTSREKPVAKQLFANPKIEIFAMNKQGETIRIAGEAVEDNRMEAKKSMLDAHPFLRGMYSETDEKTLVLYLKNAVATIASSGGKSSKEIKF
jgi:uncharacterized pyridoxamine 5'-phosphate oxidase family protein